MSLLKMLFVTAVIAWFFVAPVFADDDKYQSSNRAITVRPPVTEEPTKYSGPERIEYAKLQKGPLTPARNTEQLAKSVGRDSNVIGKVESVFIPRGENLVILNFGRDTRNCFKVVINRRDFFKWGTDDPAVIGKMYENQNVAAEGLIVLYQEKPQIAATLPGQLKLVTGGR
jgi:hypothetical protein